ncbi:hypothetical protein D6C85_10133 [Aureobasidium pullulans]|uniref:F-box domain-containing protein n=1 Tax=Aureobasidium pullulans TaxID=5580 RepID=A0A4S9W2W3_AURPU|nr:hypothetical protein D6C85_10133 [Aureobasidium pullulans]TIA01718.1 hypothetical protein D6C82_03442 [Aureobasidium pullulans]
MSPIMFEQLHSGELQLGDIGTFILEGRCSNSIQARRRHHDTPNLSKNAQKIRKRFADLWQRCMSLQSVCPCHIWCFGSWAYDSGLRPNSRTCHLLDRILLEDDRISNPYLTWSRQDLISALMQRKEQLPKNSNRVAYRLSLEAADQNRRFPFMKLPSEIRMIIYENIMQVDFGKEISAKENSKFSPPIMSVSRQVRREATTILFQNLRTTDIRLHGGIDWALPDLIFEYGLDKIDRSWLKHLGPQKITEFRTVIIEGDSTNRSCEIKIDLTCTDTTSWKYRQIFDCDFDCPLRWRNRSIFGEAKPSCRGPLSTSELQPAQIAMDQFVDLCGGAKNVRPTIRGLDILARAVMMLRI